MHPTIRLCWQFHHRQHGSLVQSERIVQPVMHSTPTHAVASVNTYRNWSWECTGSMGRRYFLCTLYNHFVYRLFDYFFINIFTADSLAVFFRQSCSNPFLTFFTFGSYDLFTDVMTWRFFCNRLIVDRFRETAVSIVSTVSNGTSSCVTKVSPTWIVMASETFGSFPSVHHR